MIALTGIFISFADITYADTIYDDETIYYPSGLTDFHDRKSICEILSTYQKVKLVSGETYYLTGNIYMEDGWIIDATGATIITGTEAVRNELKDDKANYNAINNVTIIGGTWKSSDPDNFKSSMFQFVHGNNITIKGATIEANYRAHGIELIACKNVVIENCTLLGYGTPEKGSVEEQIQIDIANKATAPSVASKYGDKYCNNNCCQNITIKNCTVEGCRGVCANYARADEKSYDNFHKNIVITGCKLKGLTAEGLALFNVAGATIKNNTIISESDRTTESYSVGLNLQLFGNNKDASKSKYIFQNNTVKGGREGLLTYSHSDAVFGQITAKKNKCYSINGKEKALCIYSAKKLVNKKNKLYGAW